MSEGRVLIVDDERAMCELMNDALTMRNYEAAWCQPAAEAMEMLGESDFDVVLTDVKMPGTTGLQLCRQINETRPDIPVVVMTAFGTMETAVDAMRLTGFQTPSLDRSRFRDVTCWSRNVSSDCWPIA